MRRAIVIAAHYPASSAYPNDPNWAADAELVAARLAQHGYRSVRVSAEHGIDGVREQLRIAPRGEPTLLYFAGYLLLTKTGEPALLLGGDTTQTLGLKALVHRASAQLDHALLVLDVRAGSEIESAVEFSDTVLLERALTSASEPNVDLIVRLHSWDSTSDVNAATFYDILGTLAHEPRAITTEDLATALGAAEQSTPVRFCQSSPPFVVLPERQYTSNAAALKAAPTISIRAKVRPLEGSPAATTSASDAPLATPSAIPALRLSAPPKPSHSPKAKPHSLEAREAAGTPSVEPLRSPPPKPSAGPRPPPKPATASSLPPLEPHAGSVLPPPKPRASQPPPKPRAESDHPKPVGPLSPMAIKVVLSPPPSVPDLEPPPPSWAVPLERAAKEDGGRTVSSEDELEKALLELRGEAQLDQRVLLCGSFLEQHPDSKLALHRLTEDLSHSQQWMRLVSVYDALLSLQTSKEVVVQLCLAQARLLGNRLGDHRAALPAIERATEIEPRNHELQLEAAALYEQLHDLSSAKAHYLAALRAAPVDVEVQHRLCAFFVFCHDADRAFQAAAILDGLEAATEQERALYQGREPGALPKPARSLGIADWMLGLEPGARDPAFTTLLELVSDTALSCFKPNREQIGLLRGRLQLEDVASSTTTLARSLSFATQFLGLPRPALYVEDGAAQPVPLPIHNLAWVVGRDVGRGASQAELVFHWARSLSGRSGTARVLRLFADPGSLDALLSACFVAVKKPAPNKSPLVLDLALAFRQRLGQESLRSLLTLLETAGFDEWRDRLARFLDEVALTSNRTGLLSCGDPQVAAQALARLDPSSEELERQLADLFCYALSDEYAELRRRLGLGQA